MLGEKNSSSARGRAIKKAYKRAKSVCALAGKRNSKLNKKVRTRGGTEESVFQVTKGYWESIAVPNPSHQRVAVKGRNMKYQKQEVNGEHAKALCTIQFPKVLLHVQKLVGHRKRKVGVEVPACQLQGVQSDQAKLDLQGT